MKLNYIIKVICVITFLILHQDSYGKFYMAANHINLDISVEKCIKTAVRARSIIDDSDSEDVILDEYFSYNPNGLSVIVVCNESRGVVFISAAAEKDQVLTKVISAFDNAFKKLKE